MSQQPGGGARRRPVSLPPRRQGMDHLDRMNRTLQRLERTVTQRIHECREEAGESSELAGRARRLNDRIKTLHFKLRNAYSSAGHSAPANLQQELQALAENDRDDAPPEFLCAISQTLMVDPVKTADGNIYDRPSILEWFATFARGTPATSPLTNLPLANNNLEPQGQLRRRIAHFMKKGELLPEENAAAERRDAGAHDGPEDGDPGRASLKQAHRGSSSTPPPPQRPVGDGRAGEDSLDPRSVDEAIQMARLRHLAPSPFEAAEEAARERAKERALTRAPIWGSSVVPAGEENSRVLNMLRVHEGSEEEVVPAASGGPTVGVRPIMAVAGAPVGRSNPSGAPAASRLAAGRARHPMVPTSRPVANGPTVTSTRAAPAGTSRAAASRMAAGGAGRAPVTDAPTGSRRPDLYNFNAVPPTATGGSASRLLRQQRSAPLTSTRAEPTTPPPPAVAPTAGRRPVAGVRVTSGAAAQRSPSAGSPRGRNLNSRQGARR